MSQCLDFHNPVGRGGGSCLSVCRIVWSHWTVKVVWSPRGKEEPGRVVVQKKHVASPTSSLHSNEWSYSTGHHTHLHTSSGGAREVYLVIPDSHITINLNTNNNNNNNKSELHYGTDGTGSHSHVPKTAAGIFFFFFRFAWVIVEIIQRVRPSMSQKINKLIKKKKIITCVWTCVFGAGNVMRSVALPLAPCLVTAKLGCWRQLAVRTSKPS